MDQKHKLVSITINDLTVTVDEETAEAIENDQNVVNQYYMQLQKLVNSAETTESTSTEITENIVWKSSKPTERDNAATIKLLELRLKLNHKFKDKKSSKNSLWSLIAQRLNNDKFYVGDGTEGRERVRHKFANLQAAYVKYKDKQKMTGQGKVIPPPFYDEIDAILGDKDKISPVYVIDSGSENLPSTSQMNEERNQPSTSKETSSRFGQIASTARPVKNEILQKFYELSKEESINRRKEFDRMSFMEKQADQRHQQIMKLLEKKAGNERSSSEDSD